MTANDRRVAALENIHQGRRCFILGNGPSLHIEDLDRLQNEITFACNKIYLAFEKTEWRPTYYSVYDMLVAENNRDEIESLNLNKIYGENISAFFDNGEAVWVKALPIPVVDGNFECEFSTDLLDGAYGGWTVIYLQLQLAFYMGIREFYLIGVDFSFDVPKSTGKMSGSGEILESHGEINHFHPEYRKPGETWTVPLLDLQRKSFAEAKNAIESHGGMIFNASRRTKLDILPCVDFDELFSEKV